MAANLNDQIIAHQRELEWRFGAAVMRWTPTVIRDQGWLSPDLMIDVTMREFWQMVLSGKDPTQAAIELKALRKLIQYDQTLLGMSMTEGIARSIAVDAYKTDIAQGISSLAGIIVDGSLEEIKTAVGEIQQTQMTQTAHGESGTDTAIEFMDSLDDEPDVIKTGIYKIDDTFGGWSKKSLSIIAARPSMGKTALALQMARAAIDQGKKVLYVSLEMSRKQLWSRMVMGEAQLDHRIYKRRTYNEAQRRLMCECNSRMVDAYGERLIIDDRSVMTSSDIWASMIAYRPDMLIVDHLSLLADPGDNQNYRIGKISQIGKSIAKEFNCASIYLCQLSRGIEGRADKIPNMADLRDSGEIEQNADVVMFIHRPDYYDQKQKVEISDTQLILAKDREGARNVNYDTYYHLIKQAFFGTAEDAR
jgi:replicative DNA helicase